MSGDQHLVLSVVIASHNGATRLPTALAALRAQRGDVPFEVVVVDDASTDATADVAAAGGARVVRLEHNVGHGAAMNEGVRVAAGRFLAFTDDDCVPPADWIEQLARAWASVGPEVTMVGGPVVPASLDTFHRRYVAYREPLRAESEALAPGASIARRLRFALARPRAPEVQRPILYAVGANMSIRADAARDVGGFTARRGAGEEASIALPLRERFGPGTVQFFPSVVMRHEFGATVGDSLRRARSYGRAHGRDWVLDGGHPMLRPTPLLLAVSLLAAAAASIPLAVAALALGPLALYRRWAAALRDTRRLEVLAYPLVEVVEEACDVLGFAEGALGELRARRA